MLFWDIKRWVDIKCILIVGVGGIGVTLILVMNAGRWRDASSALWGIIIVVLFVDYFSTRIRRNLVNG